MRTLFALLPLAALPFLSAPGAPDDGPVHDAMEAMETHLEALSDASLSALMAEASDDTSAFSSSAQTALDGLAEALHPVLLSTPKPPRGGDGAEAPSPRALQERELAYQRQMVASLDTILEAEQALIRGEWEAVQACVDRLYEQEDKGHEEFRPRRKRKQR